MKKDAVQCTDTRGKLVTIKDVEQTSQRTILKFIVPPHPDLVQIESECEKKYGQDVAYN